MLNVTGDTYEMTWDRASRLATLRFSADTRATGHDAATLIDALTTWIADDPRPFALLGDGGRLKGVDAEYRSRWNRFLRQHKDRCFIAFFNMGALIRIAAEMFRIGSGLQLKAFADEESARAWLRGVGIAA
ncbi:MAG: STAS/SEC14 domain-containing protein [Candidatus Limnocylindria bacterium]